MGISDVTNLYHGKVKIQLKCCGKHFNRFNGQIISDKNRKNAEIRLIFPRRIAKIASIKTIESCHFWCNNTDLFCEEYLTAT